MEVIRAKHHTLQVCFSKRLSVALCVRKKGEMIVLIIFRCKHVGSLMRLYETRFDHFFHHTIYEGNVCAQIFAKIGLSNMLVRIV